MSFGNSVSNFAALCRPPGARFEVVVATQCRLDPKRCALRYAPEPETKLVAKEHALNGSTLRS